MEYKVPELGEGVHEGELVRWRVKVGDAVVDDQPLAEVMTDKATVELPSPFAGTIEGLNAKEGEMVKVGQAIIQYSAGGGKAVQKNSPSLTPVEANTPPKSSNGHGKVAIGQPPSLTPVSQPAPLPRSAAGVSGGGLEGAMIAVPRALAAPSTRRAAREMGIELSQVQGSGPHGRVMRADLDRHVGSSSASAGSGAPSVPSVSTPIGTVPARPAGGEQRVAFKGLRRKIAERMRESKDHAAHFTYVEEADASELVRLRNEAKELGAKSGVKITYLPFVMKAMTAALRHFPILNSSLDEEKKEIVYKYYYNIGLSVQTDDGLVAPVVKNVEHKSIIEIAQEIQGLVDRARTKRLTLEDLQHGTITLTNAGSIGGLFATPVINYPEVAILGLNKIFRKPVVRTVDGKEEIAIRDWTYFSISLDHRVVDGAVGAEFMKTFIRYIENPSLLLLESF